MRRLALATLALAMLAAACGDDTVVTATAGAVTTAPATTAGASTTAASSTTTAATTVDDCPSGYFLIDQVDAYQQTGGNPDPEVGVTCDTATFRVTSNNIPSFEYVQVTPNTLQAQDIDVTIPLTATARSAPGAIGLGPIGITVTGLALFGAFEAPQDGYQDPYLDGLLDFCNGHTAPGGIYHFHARYDCIFDDPTQVGLVYGYLFDGYQVVGPWVCTDSACTASRKVTSSYVRTDPNSLGAFEAWEYIAGSGDLDVCNGMTGADGVYRYYLTDDFPYLPFCFHGETSYAQGDFAGEPPAGGPGG